MTIDRTSGLPVHLQLKRHLLSEIRSGRLAPGSLLPTEAELCRVYGISRFPVRQALSGLVEEGYLRRTPRLGTFVREDLPPDGRTAGPALLGLVQPDLGSALVRGILEGFEQAAAEAGFATLFAQSGSTPEGEQAALDRLAALDPAGIALFPLDEEHAARLAELFRSRSLPLLLLDRAPRTSSPAVDAVMSDHAGGAYAAVRHLALRGYRNVGFVTDRTSASSVDERLEGYLQAVRDFGLVAVPHVVVDEEIRRFPYAAWRHHLDRLRDELLSLRSHFPLGLFAMNDMVALQCMRILLEEGIDVGGEVGLVGFDNDPACDMAPVPLTSVAQNGRSLGRAAAEILAAKAQGHDMAIHRRTVPTQLVPRESCGERR